MKTLLNATMLLMLAGCSFGAAPNDSTAATPNPKAPSHQMLKVSRDGFAAMRAVRAARIAIFDGDPQVAVKMLVKATADLDAASKDRTTYVIDAKAIVDGKVVKSESADVKPDLIPIDGQIALADTFVLTEENAKHVSKANEHFKKGEGKEALEELRLGGIGVTFSRVLMPLKETMNRVAEATKLADEHKYYEANLALKAAEDGLVVDSVSLIDVPKDKNGKPIQGKMEGAKPAK